MIPLLRTEVIPVTHYGDRVTYLAACPACGTDALWTMRPAGTGNADPDIDCQPCDKPATEAVARRFFRT